MDPGQCLILAVVQAATEFLPVSSSGHLLFMKGLFGMEEMPILLDVVLHAGSLAAVLFFFRKNLAGTFKQAGMEIIRREKRRPNARVLVYVIISSAVTVVLFRLFGDAIEKAFHEPKILPLTFGITTAILALTFFFRKTPAPVPVHAKSPVFPVLVGLLQGIAILPGVSRSGSTISASLCQGVRKDESVYYSFLLFIPAMIGAIVFEGLEPGSGSFLSEHAVLLGILFVVSALASFLFLALLSWITRKGSIHFFAVYTGAMAVISWLLFR
ncbi:MAG: undecaprenyl-diphosphate phosphatase [Acidobacteria bacterium]|nr:undecaprenyl-diphosphate phosphatase [Acidobacteriota bacterium]